ncbi:DUF3261 domain-containing protein [Aliidiomarina sp. Khilg15.8]
MSRLLILLTFAVTLAACSSTPQPVSPRQVPLGAGFFELYAGAAGESMYSLHEVTWHGEETRQLLLHLEEYPDRIQLAGLSAGGQALFEVHLRPGELRVEGVEAFNQPRVMALMLAQMQLSRLPESRVREQLVGLQLSATASERRVTDSAGELVLLVRYGDGETIIEHSDYQVHVRLLEEEIL